MAFILFYIRLYSIVVAAADVALLCCVAAIPYNIAAFGVVP